MGVSIITELDLWYRQIPSNSVQDSAHTQGVSIRLIHGSLIQKLGDFQDLPVQSKCFMSMSLHPSYPGCLTKIVKNR